MHVGAPHSLTELPKSTEIEDNDMVSLKTCTCCSCLEEIFPEPSLGQTDSTAGRSVNNFCLAPPLP